MVVSFRFVISAATDFDFQNMLAIAAAIAFGAADEDVAEELHLDLLETGTAAFLALTDAGVEAEGASVQAALLCNFGLCEDFADVVEGTDVNGRIGSWGFAERGLVHEDDLSERFKTGEDGRWRMEDGTGVVVRTAFDIGIQAIGCFGARCSEVLEFGLERR